MCTGEGCGTLAGLRNSLMGGKRFCKSTILPFVCLLPGYVWVEEGVKAKLKLLPVLLQEPLEEELLSDFNGLRGMAPEHPDGQPL